MSRLRVFQWFQALHTPAASACILLYSLDSEMYEKLWKIDGESSFSTSNDQNRVPMSIVYRIYDLCDYLIGGRVGEANHSSDARNLEGLLAVMLSGEWSETDFSDKFNLLRDARRGFKYLLAQEDRRFVSVIQIRGYLEKIVDIFGSDIEVGGTS